MSQLNSEIKKTIPSLPLLQTDDEEYPFILSEEEIESIIYWETQAQKSRFERSKKYLSGATFSPTIDEYSLLKEANKRKHWELERIKDDNTEINNSTINYTAGYFYSLITEYWNILKIHMILEEDDKKYIKTMCYYMARDERLESELGLSLKKGIWVQGTNGQGKTQTVRALSKNKCIPISMYNILDIVDKVKEDGFCTLKELSTCHSNRLIFIDDIGTEESVVNYGTKINWFKEFIEKYYFKQLPFERLIITTNSNLDAIEDMYGKRVRSRIIEMFNIVTHKGRDKRN